MEPRSAANPPAGALPGLPDHEVVKELGRGGMGVVYLATNKVMGREEVLKVVNPQMLAEAGAMDRFLQEIRSAAQLSHANIVTAHAVLRSGDSLVLAMEHVLGENLHKTVTERGPLPIPNACYYAHQVALGLQHAYEKGMVHRDIKPDNLMLAREGKKHIVKILDFGLAKVTREKEQQSHNLTGDGKMMGTPDYIAPEQILDAAKADIRADIYSLGCTLYFLLTGQPPFQGGSLYEKLQAHMTRMPTSVRELRKDVPSELAAIVEKMMAKDAAARYLKPAEVAQALVPFIKGIKALPGATDQADAGKIQKLSGAGGKTKGDAHTLVPAETSRKTVEAPKRTMIESAPVETARPPSKSRPPQPAPAAKSGLKLLLIGGGVSAGFVFLLGLCGAGLWLGGVFSMFKSDRRQAEIKPVDEPVKEKDGKPGDTKPPISDLPEKGPTAVGPVDPPQAQPGPGPGPDEGWTPLFTGKDLQGWQAHLAQRGNWRTVNGVLLGSGPEQVSHLYTTRGDYTDFHLKLEALSGSGSGVYFRSSFGPVLGKKPTYPAGYNAKLDLNRLGGLILEDGKTVGPPIRNVSTPFIPVGNWVKMYVIAEGNHIVVKINDQVTADFTDPLRRFTKGRIALQQHGPQPVQYRAIEIKEVKGTPPSFGPPSAPIGPQPQQAPKEEPFIDLFNGKDLAGWTAPPGQTEKWTVKDAVLTPPGKKASYLYTEKADFKNFHLRAKARVKDDTNGGIYLRVADVATTQPQGYRILLNYDILNDYKAGSLFNGFRTDLKPVRESPVVAGKWFTLDAIALKNRIVVRIDGKQLVNFTDEKPSYSVGRLVLEQAGDVAAPEFESIGYRELDPDAKLAMLDPAADPTPNLPAPAPKPGGFPGGANRIVLNLKGTLKATDPLDPARKGPKNGRMHVHLVRMEMGKSYTIALNSTAFDAFLRLENLAGFKIAEDDDSGGGLNARIIHRCTATGNYRIVATSFDGRIGPYQLLVQETP